MRDRRLLERARHEAARAGWLWTAPNPRVGALALSGGLVAGRGCHRRVGGAHAEEEALRDAGAWQAGEAAPRPGVVDELVVSLEPCSSPAGREGKRRPPCTEALLAAGVRRVVVGRLDPDPRHRGRGVEALRAAGVEVVVLEEPPGPDPLLGAFEDALRHPERPWVLLKWAQGFDGRAAAPGGFPRWISSPESRREVHRLRALGDAILAGPGTLLQDDPRLDARPEDFGDPPAARPPLRVLLDPRAEVPPEAAVRRRPGRRIWLRAEGAPAQKEDPEDAVWFLPPRPDGRLDLVPALARLRAEEGVRRLFVEGGPRLQGDLLERGLADALLRYEAPLLLGGPVHALPGSGDPGRVRHLVDPEAARLGPDRREAWRLLEAPAPEEEA